MFALVIFGLYLLHFELFGGILASLVGKGKCDCYLGNVNGSLKQSPASTHSHKAIVQA